MIHQQRFTFLFCLMAISCSFLWTACNKLDEINEASINQDEAEFAVPLFNSSVSFQDIIDNFDENTFVSIDSDGLMRLNYKGDVLTVSSQDLFDNVPLVGPFIILDTNYIVPVDIPGSIDIDFMDFKKGSAVFYFENAHLQDVEVDVILEEIQKDGQPLQTSFTMPASSGVNPTDQFITLDLEGWRWNSLDDKFTINYVATKADGVRDTLESASVTLIGLEYTYAEGYLGNDLYLIGRDTIPIDFFEDWTRGDIYFEDPQIRLTAFNSFGFPVDGQFEEILVNTVSGETVALESEFVTNGVYIDYPLLDQVGETIPTYFSFDKNNSNIREVLGAGPTAIDYRIDGEPNPNMDETIRGFMTDSSQLRVQMEVELPIYGAASGFAVQDTLEVDFGGYDQVEEAEFKLISDNGMPLAADVQVYFADANNTILDSLLTTTQRVVEAASVDTDGMVTNNTEQILFIPVQAARLDKILMAKKIILRTAFSTTNDGQNSVRVLADQSVNLRMGVRFGI